MHNKCSFFHMPPPNHPNYTTHKHIALAIKPITHCPKTPARITSHRAKDPTIQTPQTFARVNNARKYCAVRTHSVEPNRTDDDDDDDDQQNPGSTVSHPTLHRTVSGALACCVYSIVHRPQRGVRRPPVRLHPRALGTVHTASPVSS